MTSLDVLLGPSGLLTAPRGARLTPAMAEEIREQWASAEGRIAILEAGWRFRQRLPDGTFEPEMRDFPDEWYQPQGHITFPDDAPLRMATFAAVVGTLGALAGIVSLVAVLVR